MPTYRVRYRIAAAGDQPAGPWSTSVERVFATPQGTYSHTFEGLTNGIRYEFAVGRVDNTGRVGSWSSIPDGTPFGDTGTYNSLGTFQVNGTDIQTISRTSTSTVLTLKANWEYVTVDYTPEGGSLTKRGVLKTNGGNLPTGYTANVAVIEKDSNTQVTIKLGSSQGFTITVQGNGGSTASYTLLAVP